MEKLEQGCVFLVFKYVSNATKRNELRTLINNDVVSAIEKILELPLSEDDKEYLLELM